MTIRKSIQATALAALFLPVAAFATDPGFYAGGKIGAASTDEEFIDDDDSSFGVYAGYRFNPYFALEGEYTDFGDLEVDLTDLDIGSSRAEPRSWGLKAVGFVPMGRNFELLGSIGYQSFDLDPRDGAGFRQLVGTDSSTDLFYGLGGQFNLDNGVSLRAQYQRYEFKQAGRSDELSLGVHYRF